jgi:Mg-chelatase subunit ChlD
MMAIDEKERTRRWRLVLGKEGGEGISALGSEEGFELSGSDVGMDNVLSALYNSERNAGLGKSSPNVTRWLGDIRTYFPTSVVQIMQKDALDRLNLQQMLLEPEMLENVEPDVHLVANLLSLSKVIPEKTKETARQVVHKVVGELERKLASGLIQAVRGSLNRATRTYRPRPHEINWDRTIRLNLKNYQKEKKIIIPERMVGHGHKRSSLRDIVLCVDQSGSMATSVVYAGIFGAILATLRSVSTRMVVFDTEVVDLTDDLQDPVDLLFGVQLGGGTDINRALAYCQQIITRPTQTILVLITDLYEGGNAQEMLRRSAEMRASGVQVICLLALSDKGSPIFHEYFARKLANLDIPSFACTPDLFADLMAAAIQRQDMAMWAAKHDIVIARRER